ncbi:2-C-methyl-D-erythritol 4-phosphate cytidylyltransferase [Nocardioides sp. R-C-SC26]|uniref:2-C-methyl-D-erythritol 4-phosphate cytidylyltransferase n=1 Tax=Nocardioides sp. R-C-SC26 TaxID=2870414 RepID=UPI001E2FC576|nr:2-C-methyl-D-erythritol 4-phosphate cytidylyltransferase [Nocardioides sp. R-C-SC26]
MDDDVTAWGLVLVEERGSLPFALVHGESLVAATAWAAGEAGVSLVDASVPWSELCEAAVEEDAAVVLLDSLCPMTPPAFIASCVERATSAERVVVGVRPVTDTVKRTRSSATSAVVVELGGDVDRDDLVMPCSPVVVPPRLLAPGTAAGDAFSSGWESWVGSTDLADLVVRLRQIGEDVVLAEAPASARRVGSLDDVALVEAATRPDDVERELLGDLRTL